MVIKLKEGLLNFTDMLLTILKGCSLFSPKIICLFLFNLFICFYFRRFCYSLDTGMLIGSAIQWFLQLFHPNFCKLDGAWEDSLVC